MRKSLKTVLLPAALALATGAGIAATTAAPANAQVRFDLHLGTPGYYYHRPHYYRPYYAPYGYYRHNCYWDRYYGRVCY